MFNRHIRNFKGERAVIGCSHRFSCNGVHLGKNNYYTIDINSAIRPDLVMDLTKELPTDLKSRFKLTLLENIDWSAYNDPPPGSNIINANPKGHAGFDNALAMTDEDGFVFILGCPRVKEFRNSIQNLKYIEIDRDDDPYGCVLIPKNQLLNIDVVRQRISSDPEITRIINKIQETTYYPEPSGFVYCDIPFENMPIMRDECKIRRETEKHDQTLLTYIDQLKTQFSQIENLYQAIENLYGYGKILRDKNNDYSLYSKAQLLKKHANDFFKHPIDLIKKDIVIFQNKFTLLLQKQQQSLFQTNNDILLLFANIALALTVLGAIAVGVKLGYSYGKTGRCLPFFFNSEPHELKYAVEKTIEPLKSVLRQQG